MIIIYFTHSLSLFLYLPLFYQNEQRAYGFYPPSYIPRLKKPKKNIPLINLSVMDYYTYPHPRLYILFTIPY